LEEEGGREKGERRKGMRETKDIKSENRKLISLVKCETEDK
jgi:hypothetical protein